VFATAEDLSPGPYGGQISGGCWDAACRGYLRGGPCGNGHYWILELDEYGNEVPPEDGYLCPECRELVE
jgi:hypothetical protein